MPDDRLPDRALRTTFWLLAWFVAILSARGWSDVALGLAAGGAIGLFSLWSLCRLTPRLARPGARRAGLLVGLVLLAKLPIYGAALYFIMQSALFHPLAVFAGVAAGPAVIVLKVVGQSLSRRTDAAVGDGACRSDQGSSN